MSEEEPGFRISWRSWLILFAIVGVIAAIAIPSYGDYTHRAQASEAISLMMGTKTPLWEHFDEKKKWPEALDKVGVPTSGKYTQSVAITKGAGGIGELEITATMKSEGVDRRVAGQSIRLSTSDAGKTWTCRPGTMPAKNLPATCRD
jgi:type IV pilus assembly protein PilA